MSKRILSVVLALTLLLSVISVAGFTTTSAAGVTVTPVTAVPAGSLLAGLRPVSGIEGQTALSCYGGTALKNLTDGVFVDSAQTGRWMGWTSTGSRISFNLGTVAEVSQFLIGSEAGADQYADKVKIYVSETVCDPRTELYAEGNLVADVTGLKAAQNNLVTMSGAVKAIMIGFDFTGSTCNAYDTIRLGELGAYGTQNAVAADTQVNPVTAIPTETNLLKTATATINNSGGNDSRLTDDVLCTDAATRWQCATWRWGNQTWDLGDIYDIDKVLIGSEYGSEQFVKFVNIYVSNDKATLFTADTLVLSANGYYSGIGANKDNLLSSASDKAIQGRYVGFEFTNNSTYNGGHMQSFLRLGELGVYGTKVTAEGDDEDEGEKDYVTYNAGNVAANLTPAADNVLKSATSAYYRANIASSNKTDSKLTSTFMDGDVSTGSALNTSSKNDGTQYFYITYDMGKDYAFTSLFYAAQSTVGANAVAVYVGDKDLADVMSADPDLFYDGAVGTNTDFLNNKVTDVVAIRFNKELTGRYVTFRLSAGTNAGYQMVWVGEFAATGKVAEEEEPETPTNQPYVTFAEDLAADKAIKVEDNLLANATAAYYRADTHTDKSMSAALLSTFVDGSIKTGNTLNTGTKNDGSKYIYITYDLGSSQTIRSLYYAANGTTGVNSIGVYVGDKDLADVMGTDPDIFYDGAIGTNKDYMKNNVTDAVAILFDKEMTGRYVTFRLGVGINAGWAMVWLSELGASAKAPAREIMTYNADQVKDSVIAATDNLLAGAKEAYYNTNKTNSNKTDDKLTGMFADGNLSTGSALNTGSKNDGTTHFYFTYDLGMKHDITALYYAGQGAVGANSIAVYVTDEAPTDLVSAEPTMVYDGAIGTNTDYMKNNVTDAVAIRFNKKMTGRYVTFRLGTANNANYQMVWISEFAALGSKISYTQKGVTSTEDLPEKQNMVLGKTPYKLDGTSISIAPNGGAITNVNDGKIQGVNQPITYLLSETEKTAERGGVTYYNPIAPKEFVEKYYPDYDSSKTWYFKSQNGLWRDSNVSTTRAMMNSANAQFVYDLGAISKIEDILIASSWELQGMGANGVTTEAGVYKPTLEQVEATMSPLKGDSLLYKVEVYVADEFEDLLDTTKAKRIIAYNHSKDVGNMNIVNLFTLTEAVEGRYVYFDLTGSTNGNLTRVSELAVYGELGEIPVSLIAGDLPVVHGQINARGIDNKTAVDAFGNAGTGNTGTISGLKKVWRPGDISLLTDGSADTQANQHVASAVSDGGYLLYYDTYWVAFVYKLDGPSRIDEIIVSSSNESDYHIAGVQYYAANQYADLFKNESLLYTTGGEHYVVDEANSNEDKTAYLPDEQYDMNTKRHLSYKLTAEQQNGDYRYVGIILTRPYGMWQRSKPGTRLQGYTQYRVSEFNVYGETLSVDEPITDTYAVETSKGEATVQVGPLHFDDRDFFFNTLGGVKVTETKLPDTVNRNIYGNWLSVADDTVFTFQLLDKNGNVIPETDANEVLGVNNREIEIWMPATGSKTSTMAVLEDDTLRRLYNSFVDVNHANMVCAGCLEYPTYEGAYDYVNNRDKAILTGGTNSLVYMEFNDIDTINKLNDRMVNQPLKDFITDLTVAGVTEEAAPRWPLWLILSAAGAAVAVTAVILVRRRARRAHS